MDVLKVFRTRGKHLAWKRLDDDQVTGPAGENIVAEEAYLVLRLTEVYLACSRKLWRKYYPVVHAWEGMTAGEEHGMTSPSRLQLGESNLDRVVTLNARLIGPTPYRGGDVAIVAALYSVPGDDAAQALTETVSLLAAFSGTAVPAYEIATLVTTSIDRVLGLSETALRLGLCDTFYANNPLRSGFHVGIGADTTSVDFARLWLRDGHLLQGADPNVARPFTGHDYLVVELERQEIRDDWPGLPGITDFQSQFAAIMKIPGDIATKKAVLHNLWPRFTEALETSPHLTRTNARFIAANVAKDLEARLQALETGNPFETKSWSGEDSKLDPREIDFTDIPDYVTMSDISRGDPAAIMPW